MSATAAIFLFALPPPPPLRPEEGYTARVHTDCVTFAFIMDSVVCKDPVLLDMDRRMMALFKDLKVADTVVVEDQDLWLRRRNLCGRVDDGMACARAGYKQRIAILSVASTFDPKSTPFQTARCGKEKVEIAHLDKGVIALRRKDRVELAMAATELAAWTPSLYATLSGQKINFTWSIGYLWTEPPTSETLHCKLDKKSL